MRRILIAEGHPVVRMGYRKLLLPELGPTQFGEAASRAEVVQAIATDPWDLVLLDLTLPDRPGVEFLAELVALAPGVPVLLVSAYPAEIYAVEALRAGAAGYLSKSSPPALLVQAVRQVLGGRRYIGPEDAERIVAALEDQSKAPHERLSKREAQVFRLLAVGHSITAIAQGIDLSVKTVSTYRTRILDKMGLKTNAAITAYAMRLGLVGDSGSAMPRGPVDA